MKYFSSYTARIEQQLIGANELEIRTSVDSAYEKIVQTIFDSLKQIAKLDGEGEDKGQLNFHVILIGGFTIKNGRRLLIILQKTCTISLRKCLRWMYRH